MLALLIDHPVTTDDAIEIGAQIALYIGLIAIQRLDFDFTAPVGYDQSRVIVMMIDVDRSLGLFDASFLLLT